MSKRIFKSFIAVGVAAIVIFSATACTTATSLENPATIGETKITAPGGYTEEYVEQSDGSVVRCIFWKKQSYSATMSCDFANAENGPAK
jgi:plastocyanin domain-containing protein